MDDIDIDSLLKDRKAFDDFVYTPLDQAVIELKERYADDRIKLPFDIDIPTILKGGQAAILYVAVITPNYQIRRYIQLAEMAGLKPIVFEQLSDKFSSNNEWKHSLGKLRVYLGRDKSKNTRIEFFNILDFNKANGKRISDVKLTCGRSLIDFHHDFFFTIFPQLSANENLFDGSEWFRKHGDNPLEYYRAFLSLLIKHGIQFENFMLDEKELDFTKEVFLPAFISVYKETGKKPLIVALEPTETEGDQFWISYPNEEKGMIEEKLR